MGNEIVYIQHGRDMFSLQKPIELKSCDEWNEPRIASIFPLSYPRLELSPLWAIIALSYPRVELSSPWATFVLRYYQLEIVSPWTIINLSHHNHKLPCQNQKPPTTSKSIPPTSFSAQLKISLASMQPQHRAIAHKQTRKNSPNNNNNMLNSPRRT